MTQIKNSLRVQKSFSVELPVITDEPKTFTVENQFAREVVPGESKMRKLKLDQFDPKNDSHRLFNVVAIEGKPNLYPIEMGALNACDSWIKNVVVSEDGLTVDVPEGLKILIDADKNMRFVTAG